jgi:cyclic-di-GMP-binding protein
MPSFDIVSKVDTQTLDNAINIAIKEITNRYDFKGSNASVDLNKKDFKLALEADSEMQINQMVDVIISKSMRQGLEASIYDFTKEHYQSGKRVKKEVTIKNGLTKEDAKKVVEMIKKSGLKVQAAIMDDVVRVTGKKIDDLQDVIALCKNGSLEFPLQYINMKS